MAFPRGPDYGTPFPNTAYAKAFCPGIPADELAIQGLYYLLDSSQRDPLSLATICLALGPGLVERKLERLVWLLGACLYMAYVVKVGGDFMSGRFLTPPFLMAVIALVQSDLWQRRSSFAVLLGAAAVLLSSLFSQPALWSPADFGAAALNEHGIVNERGFYYQGLGLRSSARRSLVKEAARCRLRAVRTRPWVCATSSAWKACMQDPRYTSSTSSCAIPCWCACRFTSLVNGAWGTMRGACPRAISRPCARGTIAFGIHNWPSTTQGSV